MTNPKDKRLMQSLRERNQVIRKQNATKHKLFYVDSLLVDKLTKVFKIMGSTGNIYDVTLSNELSCTCPDHKNRGSKCKHIYFVLMKILRIKDIDQDIFTDKELKKLVAQLDIVDGIKLSSDLMLKYKRSKDGDVEIIPHDPIGLDDACPVCMDDISNGEEFLHCKWSCGRCIHTECLDIWYKKRPNHNCIFCMKDFYTKPNIDPQMNGEYINLLL